MKKASEMLIQLNDELNEMFEKEISDMPEEDANALRAMFQVEDGKIKDAIKEIEQIEEEEGNANLHDFNTLKKSITAIFN